MSERAIEFVEVWVSEHVHGGEAPDDAKPMAAQCLTAAKSAGIPQAEIEDAFEDLAAFIGGEIAEANMSRKGS